MRKDDISELTGSIWRDTLGIEVEAEAEEVRRPRKGDSKIVGVVRVSSQSFQGTVKLECSPEVARRAAAIMFEMPESEASQRDIEDAVGELTNMTGGNLKALVPGPAQLGLPKVGEEAMAETRIVAAGESCQVGFRVPDADDTFVVTLVDETGSPSPAPLPAERADDQTDK